LIFNFIHVFKNQAPLVYDKKKREIISPRIKALWEVGEDGIISLHPDDAFNYEEEEEDENDNKSNKKS